MGYSPWGGKELDTTERLHWEGIFHDYLESLGSHWDSVHIPYNQHFVGIYF